MEKWKDGKMEGWNKDGVRAGFCVRVFKAAMLPAIIQRKRGLFWKSP